MQGIIEYSSPINNDPLYRIINFDNGALYAVEIITLSGNKLCDSNWLPGDGCHAVFAITKDEYQLKDASVEALNKLVSDLYDKIPEDRLIEAFYSTSDQQKKPMKLRPECKTMDNNKYRQLAYEKNIGIPFLNSADKVYMVYDKVTTDRLPAITWNGFANIFTKREYAEDNIRCSGVSTLDIKEFSKPDFDAHVKTWHAFGIQKFNLNPGTKDHSCIIMRDNYMPDPIAKELEYNGSTLCMLIWRYRQYNAMDNKNMKALSQTIFESFCHELKMTLFLCPFIYNYENYPISEPDYLIHTSCASAEFLINKSLGENSLNINNTATANSKLKFYGGSKYKFASSENTQNTGTVCPLTANGSAGAFLPAFTDFETLHSIFGENVRVILYTYDELKTIAQNDPALNGIIINPNSATMPIYKKDMNLIEKTSREKINLYIPETQKQSEQNNPGVVNTASEQQVNDVSNTKENDTSSITKRESKLQGDLLKNLKSESKWNKAWDIDIVFCIENSQNMLPHIDRVKKWIPEWCDKIQNHFKEHYREIKDFRAKIIVFNDYRLSYKNAIMVSDFYNFKNEKETFLDALKCVQIQPGYVNSVCGMEALSYAAFSDWSKHYKTRQYIIVFSATKANDLDDPTVVPFHAKGMPGSMDEFIKFRNLYAKNAYTWLFVPLDGLWNTVTDKIDNGLCYPSVAGEGLEENKPAYDFFFSGSIAMGFD